MKQGFAAPDDTPLHMPICGILGVAILTGVSFRKALGVFEDIRLEANPRARRYGKGWKGYTNFSEQKEAFRRLGYNLGHFRLGDRTLKHWALTADPHFPFYVQVRGHIMATHGPMIFDQDAPKGKHVSEHRKRRCNVLNVYWAKPRLD